MSGGCLGEEKVSSRGMYIQSTSDILPKGKDIQNSYIPPNWSDMRSIADIPALYEIVSEEIIGIKSTKKGDGQHQIENAYEMQIIFCRKKSLYSIMHYSIKKEVYYDRVDTETN